MSRLVLLNVVDVLSIDAFNDKLLLFLLSFMSFILLTLVVSSALLLLGFEAVELLIILCLSITSLLLFFAGIEMFRILSSCLRSAKVIENNLCQEC